MAKKLSSKNEIQVKDVPSISKSQAFCLAWLSRRGATDERSAVLRRELWQDAYEARISKRSDEGFAALAKCKTMKLIAKADRVIKNDPNSNYGHRGDNGWLFYVTALGIQALRQYEQVTGPFWNKHDAVPRYGTKQTPAHPISSSEDAQDSSVEAFAEDVVDICRDVPETQQVAQIIARRGQGQFREQVLAKWNNRCCVTGSTTIAAIRASHIKPWRDCDNKERLDPDNGLPLLATLDALFDAGLITFDTNGKMLISTQLNDNEREILGVDSCKLLQTPNAKTAAFLECHREIVFQK